MLVSQMAPEVACGPPLVGVRRVAVLACGTVVRSGEVQPRTATLPLPLPLPRSAEERNQSRRGSSTRRRGEGAGRGLAGGWTHSRCRHARRCQDSLQTRQMVKEGPVELSWMDWEAKGGPTSSLQQEFATLSKPKQRRILLTLGIEGRGWPYVKTGVRPTDSIWTVDAG
jgi:hypothetical protein